MYASTKCSSCNFSCIQTISFFNCLTMWKETNKRTWLMDRACPWLSKKSVYKVSRYETASVLEWKKLKFSCEPNQIKKMKTRGNKRHFIHAKHKTYMDVCRLGRLPHQWQNRCIYVTQAKFVSIFCSTTQWTQKSKKTVPGYYFPVFLFWFPLLFPFVLHVFVFLGTTILAKKLQNNWEWTP